MKILAVLLITLTFLQGCTDAQVASSNLSKAADMFEIDRRIVFYNGITGEYMLTIEGRCSINTDGRDKQLEVVCRTGRDEYKKHFLGLSDNVTYFAEQTRLVKADVYQYRVIFKPEALLPNFDLETSTPQ